MQSGMLWVSIYPENLLNLKTVKLVFLIIVLLWNLTVASVAMLLIHLSTFGGSDNSKCIFHCFQTLQDLTIRHLIRYDPQVQTKPPDSINSVWKIVSGIYSWVEWQWRKYKMICRERTPLWLDREWGIVTNYMVKPCHTEFYLENIEIYRK